MSVAKRNGTYPSQIDVRTPTPGVYKRGDHYRVLTRPDGKRKVMHRFETYAEAVAFKAETPTRATPRRQLARQRGAKKQERPIAVEMLRLDPCAYCGGPTTEIDHIVPRSSGGDNEWTNLTASCGPCNRAKSDKPLLVFLAHQHGCYEWRRDLDASPQEDEDEPRAPRFSDLEGELPFELLAA